MRSHVKCAAFGLVLLVAMGTTCGTSPLLPGRLDVNDTLRAACLRLPTIESDADIKSIITFVENDRQNGLSKSDVLNDLLQSTCGTDVQCSACATAVIDQVFGP